MVNIVMVGDVMISVVLVRVVVRSVIALCIEETVKLTFSCRHRDLFQGWPTFSSHTSKSRALYTFALYQYFHVWYFLHTWQQHI